MHVGTCIYNTTYADTGRYSIYMYSIDYRASNLIVTADGYMAEKNVEYRTFHTMLNLNLEGNIKLLKI